MQQQRLGGACRQRYNHRLVTTAQTGVSILYVRWRAREKSPRMGRVLRALGVLPTLREDSDDIHNRQEQAGTDGYLDITVGINAATTGVFLWLSTVPLSCTNSSSIERGGMQGMYAEVEKYLKHDIQALRPLATTGVPGTFGKQEQLQKRDKLHRRRSIAMHPPKRPLTSTSVLAHSPAVANSVVGTSKTIVCEGDPGDVGLNGSPVQGAPARSTKRLLAGQTPELGVLVLALDASLDLSGPCFLLPLLFHRGAIAVRHWVLP